MFHPPLGSTAPVYKLFISHAWDYAQQYNGLEKLLNDYWGFKWENLSVPIDDPIQMWDLLPKSNRRIMRELDDRVQQCDCLLVIAAMYFKHSGWIQSEIEAAQEYGKPIIAVKPQNQERVPVALSNFATEMVGWHTPAIVSAIKKHAKPTGGISSLYGGLSTSFEDQMVHELIGLDSTKTNNAALEDFIKRS
jgi:hypothetical protein